MTGSWARACATRPARQAGVRKIAPPGPSSNTKFQSENLRADSHRRVQKLKAARQDNKALFKTGPYPCAPYSPPDAGRQRPVLPAVGACPERRRPQGNRSRLAGRAFRRPASPAEVKLGGQAVLKLPDNMMFVPRLQADRLMAAYGNGKDPSLLGVVLPRGRGRLADHRQLREDRLHQGRRRPQLERRRAAGQPARRHQAINVERVKRGLSC